MQPDHQGVENQNAEITRPAARAADRERAARREQLPQRHGGKHHERGAGADKEFGLCLHAQEDSATCHCGQCG
jgi:hypothetical protein